MKNKGVQMQVYFNDNFKFSRTILTVFYLKHPVVEIEME